tara:strand:- start:5843 stop:7135 length:1293 start_codon:yes stop_codon:yes gene_type:complete
MDQAINRVTNNIVNAFEVYKNGSYQNLSKGGWIAPTDKITNWEYLESLGIKKELVHYVKEAEFKNKSGKNIIRAPHFSLYPNSPAETARGESPEHKKVKDWLFGRLKNDDLNIMYSEGTKPFRFKNTIKLSELPIDWNNYQIPEETIKAYKKLRADVLLPFSKKHDLLGHGIIFEIQLSKQSSKKTYDRTIDRALQGYSVCWINRKDYDEEDDNIFLKDNFVKVQAFSSLIKYQGKLFIRNLKETVEDQCRYLDLKKNEAKKYCEGFIEKLEREKEKNIINIKKIINGYFIHKTNELSNNLNEKIVDKIQKDFYKKNINEIEPLIKESLFEFANDIIGEDIIKEASSKIDTTELLNKLESEIRKEVEPRLQAYEFWRQLISNPPTCNQCGSDMTLQKGQKSIFLGCGNFPSCKNKQWLTQSHQEILRRII